MPDIHIPWVGLAALLAMFVLPFLPSRLFEGPRTVKHWPRRHVCGVCNAPWSAGHTCTPQVREPCTPPARELGLPLRGELRRLKSPAELEPRRRASPR